MGEVLNGFGEAIDVLEYVRGKDIVEYRGSGMTEEMFREHWQDIEKGRAVYLWEDVVEFLQWSAIYIEKLRVGGVSCKGKKWKSFSDVYGNSLMVVLRFGEVEEMLYVLRFWKWLCSLCFMVSEM